MLSLSQRAPHADEPSYPREGVPEHSEPPTVKVPGRCPPQSGGCHRHPRGTGPAGELSSRMLCTVRVVLDTQRMLTFLRVSQVPLNDGIGTPRAGASRCLLERVLFHVETSEGVLIFQPNV